MQSDTTAGFRLSPEQEALFLTQRDEPAYRAVLALRAEGALDAGAIEGALGEVARRHEILRTTFKRGKGMKLPLQVVGEAPSLSFSTVDLRGGEGEARLAALLAEEGERAVDLGHGPLVHATLAALGDREHALVLGLPALLADAASLTIIAAEIVHFYAEKRGAVGAPLDPEPLQYADYAEFQREQAAGAAVRHSDDGAPAASPSLSLPFEQRNAEACFSPVSLAVAVPDEVAGSLSRLASTDGTSPASIALAAYAVLLARLTGAAEIAVNVIDERRASDEAEGAVGLFARAFPFRAGIDEEAPFATLVAEASAALARSPDGRAPRAEAHHTLPAFAWAPGISRIEAAGVAFSPIAARSHAGRFTVKLSLAEAADEIRAELAYDRQAHRAEDMERVAAAVSEALRTAVAAAGAKSAADAAGSTIAAVEVVDATERRRLTALAGPALAAAPPLGTTLTALIEAQARRTPEAPALAFEEQRLTYAQLDARASQLAHCLRRHGVGREDAVGLCLPRSADMIIALLGIWKASAAYVPLLPDAPRARLAHQLTETRARAVVTHEALLDALPPFAGAVVCLDRDRGRLAEEPQESPAVAGAPSDLAYVIYTSGSTGKPKGVGVTHDNLVNYTAFLCERLELARRPKLHFATVSTIAADLGNTCIFPALVSGGCLHVIDHDTGMDGARFAAYAKKSPIDVLKITPSHLAALLTAEDGAHILPRRTLVTGGEASTFGLVDRVRALRELSWLNHYGPTETTIGSLTYDLEGSEGIRAFTYTVPIGRPIANTRVYILDARRRLAPFGAPGELYIGGCGVARGYVNQPEQTAARFLDDPFAGEPGARMYRTGDRVRYLPDGSIAFLGRVDHQVKIRGFRVEIGEIEATLQRHPGVSTALVIARASAANAARESAGDLRLIAYIVPRERPAPKAEALRRALAEVLPDYMIPGAFVALDALPLTPNGKVDRAALPEPLEHARAPEAYFAPAESPTEQRIAAIWADVLKIEKVSRRDSFFDLGGHSLLATQVIARMCTVFGVQLPLRTLFETPTVEALAVAVDEARKERPADDDLGQMLNELDGLSDEEVAALLAAASGDA
jgi:amino acid adenylation domain-containing protein